MGMLFVSEAFGHKRNLKLWSDVGARWEVKISKLITIHPEGDVNYCLKFHGNPSNNCWDISVWTKLLDQQTDISNPVSRATSMVKKHRCDLYICIFLY